MGIREKIKSFEQARKPESMSFQRSKFKLGRTGKRESLLLNELYPLYNHRALPKTVPVKGCVAKHPPRLDWKIVMCSMKAIEHHVLSI